MDINTVLEQLRAAGLRVEAIDQFGKIVRVPVDAPKPDKGSKKSGWYVVYEIRLDSGAFGFVGAFGNHKDGIGSRTLSLKPQRMSEADRDKLDRQVRQVRAEREKEDRSRAQEAARRARTIWEKLPDAGKSRYLARKGVKPYGLRFARGAVVVPVRRVDGELVGLQFIGADGEKRFLTGTPKKGACHWIGTPEQGGRVAVCEGYATAATVHDALGLPVAVAFDADNLVSVADAISRAFSPALILVAGDNDARTEGNPGRTKALRAAEAVGGIAVVPRFPEEPAHAD